ncbi:MAG: hypothetical protein QOI42_1416 [Frankiaceae bacterium]|nr:hypothetical protein [Frankiaceae bacterium]
MRQDGRAKSYQRAARAVLRHPLVGGKAGVFTAVAAARFAAEGTPSDPVFEALWQRMWVPGWLDLPQAALLFHLAAYGEGTGRVVEVGSYLGRSTVVLGAGARHGGRPGVVAVDPHEGNNGREGSEGDDGDASTYALFRHHLSAFELDTDVQAIRASSTDAAATWHEPIRLLYVDGLHTEEAVHADLAAWGPFLEEGGAVVLDDFGEPQVAAGVRAALAEGVVTGPLRRVYKTAVLGRLTEVLEARAAPI